MEAINEKIGGIQKDVIDRINSVKDELWDKWSLKYDFDLHVSDLFCFIKIQIENTRTDSELSDRSRNEICSLLEELRELYYTHQALYGVNHKCPYCTKQ